MDRSMKTFVTQPMPPARVCLLSYTVKDFGNCGIGDG